MKRTLTALTQLALLGGLALAGLLMALKLIVTVLKIFAFILGEWIYTALIVMVGILFIPVPIGIGVFMIIEHYQNSKKEYESPYAREYRLRREANEKKED